MDIIYTRIKSRREKLGLNQEDLAQKIGYTAKSAISKLEHGNKKGINISMVKALATALRTSPDYLMGWTDDPEIETQSQSNNDYPETIASSTGSIDDLSPIDTPHIQAPTPDPTSTVQLPIYGNVAAGMGAYADNDIIGYEDIPQEWIRGKGDYVLLRVQGDSMYPVFMDNDLLLVKCQPIVDNGAYAVVLIDDDSGVVKRVIRGNSWVELQSVNPMYVPRRFEGADMERLRIFGLVKKSIRNYE